MTSTAAAAVLRLGTASLLQRCAKVSMAELASTSFQEEAARLQATLTAFRAKNGFGRGIAAPQIGVQKRFIAIHLDGKHTTPQVYVNPELTWRSPDLFTMWDDCMCFPDLLVRVSRHQSVSLRYQTAQGDVVEENALPQAESELFQHELDHLDGVLAVHHVTNDPLSAEDLLERYPTDVIQRSDFEANPKKYLALVDYVI